MFSEHLFIRTTLNGWKFVNMEIRGPLPISLCVQWKYRKIRNRKLFFTDFKLILCFLATPHFMQNIYTTFPETEAATGGVLKSFAKFIGKHLCQSLFFLKFQKSPTTWLKKTPALVFSGEFCEIFENNCFLQHLRTTASPDAYLGHCQLSTMGLFAKIVTNFQLLTSICSLSEMYFSLDYC